MTRTLTPTIATFESHRQYIPSFTRQAAIAAFTELQIRRAAGAAWVELQAYAIAAGIDLDELGDALNFYGV